MKRIISFLLVVTLLLSLGTVAYAAPTKSGVLKSFTASSVVLTVDGKDMTYKYDSKTKVLKIDMEVKFVDFAKKGMVVNFTNSGSKLTYIQFPNYGAELQGIATIAVADIRQNTTDSALVADANLVTANDYGTVTQTTITRFKEIAPVTVDEFAYDIDDQNLTIGDVKILPGTMKVTVDGVDLKVIDTAAKFDATTVGDEVKLALKGTLYTLAFEKPFNSNPDATQEDIEKMIKVSYTKKMYLVTTTETNFMLLNDKAVIELNGKVVSAAKAISLGNMWATRCNTLGEIIHADAYFNAVDAVVKKVAGNKLTVTIVKNGNEVADTTVTLNKAVDIQDPMGAQVDADYLTPGTAIKITTEPAANYTVTLINVK